MAPVLVRLHDGATYIPPGSREALRALRYRARSHGREGATERAVVLCGQVDELSLYTVLVIEGMREFDSMGEFGADSVLANVTRSFPCRGKERVYRHLSTSSSASVGREPSALPSMRPYG